MWGALGCPGEAGRAAERAWNGGVCGVWRAARPVATSLSGALLSRSPSEALSSVRCIPWTCSGSLLLLLEALFPAASLILGGRPCAPQPHELPPADDGARGDDRGPRVTRAPPGRRRAGVTEPGVFRTKRTVHGGFAAPSETGEGEKTASWTRSAVPALSAKRLEDPVLAGALGGGSVCQCADGVADGLIHTRY